MKEQKNTVNTSRHITKTPTHYKTHYVRFLPGIESDVVKSIARYLPVQNSSRH